MTKFEARVVTIKGFKAWHAVKAWTPELAKKKMMSVYPDATSVEITKRNLTE